jgi:hypothetical protein
MAAQGPRSQQFRGRRGSSWRFYAEGELGSQAHGPALCCRRRPQQYGGCVRVMRLLPKAFAHACWAFHAAVVTEDLRPDRGHKVYNGSAGGVSAPDQPPSKRAKVVCMWPFMIQAACCPVASLAAAKCPYPVFHHSNSNLYRTQVAPQGRADAPAASTAQPGGTMSTAGSVKQPARQSGGGPACTSAKAAKVWSAEYVAVGTCMPLAVRNHALAQPCPDGMNGSDFITPVFSCKPGRGGC